MKAYDVDYDISRKNLNSKTQTKKMNEKVKLCH